MRTSHRLERLPLGGLEAGVEFKELGLLELVVEGTLIGAEDAVAAG